MTMKKEKTLEALLVIITGFLLLFLIYEKEWMLYVSFGTGIAGILVKPLATLLAKGWFKLGDLLGFVVSKVVLAVMFFIILTPIAFLYNIFNRDTLHLKRKEKSLWSDRNHSYVADDMNNSW
jgi:hypothetical protein